jgi:hypothetical protein
MIAVLCFLVAGFLGGGAYSLARQGTSWIAVGILGVLAVIATAAGLLWLI